MFFSRGRHAALWASAASLLASRASAIDLDIDSPQSIRSAAKTIAANLYSYYHGDEPGNTPGILPGPPPMGDYYWWEAGAMWGTFIDYWHFTGDSTYNNESLKSMVFQAGAPSNSFQPANVTLSLGNDDQGFWGLSSMLAAEVVFQDPPSTDPQWLALAQAVWNTQAAPDRHDTECGGGLRWQIPFSNNGYDYKNSIANGIFFNMGARLARYTGNDTYAKIARETWDWETGVGLMSANYDVYDGAHVGTNCTDITKAQFSYNAGVWLQGAAFMYNYTHGADEWRGHVQGLLNRTMAYFFDTNNGTLVEVSCELPTRVQCKTDMLAFKGFLLRWMATVAQVAPFTHDTIASAIRLNAKAAAASCDSSGACGVRWTTNAYDGQTGVGQQMNALGAISALLFDQSAAPATNATGTSQGDAAAGLTPVSEPLDGLRPIHSGDRVGAGFLTFFALTAILATFYWLLSESSEGASSSIGAAWNWRGYSISHIKGAFSPKA